MRYIYMILALVGCAQDPIGNDFPDQRALYSLVGWQEHGNPVGTCLEEVKHIRLLITDTADAEDKCDHKMIFGCFNVYNGYPLIIVDRAYFGYDDFEETIDHELRHWMAGCSLEDMDDDHNDPRIWYWETLKEGWIYE